MSRIAVLGLGAMGSRMAVNLIHAGHELTVWNFNPKRKEALLLMGARDASSPREAASGSEFVLSMVRDDQASRSVWLDPTSGALAGMMPGTIAIESSTLTPAWTRELGAATKAAGMELLEAPVSGSTPQAERGELIFLVGGERAALDKARDVLRAMGKVIQHAGSVGAGAFAKLVTNTLMGVQITALAEMIGMLKKHGVDPEAILNAVSHTTIWSQHLTADTTSMLSGDFAARFPVALLEKDLSYTIGTAGGDKATPTVSAVRDVLRRAIHQGLGESNMTSVVKLFAHD